MKPYYDRSGITVLHADCRDALPAIPSASIDAIVSDPPYPEIDRPYGRLTEAEWHDLMRFVVGESRRVLKPKGSAVFVLQPNSERVGRMRPWLWEFMAWTAREWGQVQDAWWWNTCALPMQGSIGGAGRGKGSDAVGWLLRPSLKACVWLGPPDCHRDQGAVLWGLRSGITAESIERRAQHHIAAAKRGGYRTGSTGRIYRPSGIDIDPRAEMASIRRGGTTPFNVLPMANEHGRGASGTFGHGAATPLPLCRWWVRYICPPGGVVLDPFFGVGTVGRAARIEGRRCIGIEQMDEYVATAARILDGERLDQEVLPLGGAA